MKKIILILFLAVAGIAKAEEKRILTSDGVALYVKVEGEGLPLLYLHGGPGSGSYWFEKFFGNFMEENFKVIYLDQRGVSRSSSPENGDYSIERMAQDFEEVREALGIKKWFTLGHSFGGLLQVAYAEGYPEAHLGMMMINCTLNLEESFCESWAPKASEILADESFKSCALDTVPLMDRMNILGSKLREKDKFWKMAYSNPQSEVVMNATFSEIENWNYDFGNHALKNEDYWKNYKPTTANIKIPVLFFYGTKDWMVGPDHYKTIKFPEMILWKSEGGHIPFQEDRENLEDAILTYTTKYKFN